MPLAIALLLLSVSVPEPPTPPETVRRAVPLELLLVRVVPTVLFTVIAVVLIVRAELVLLSIIPVTFEPMPPLIVVVAVLVPVFVTVPTLLIAAVEKRIVPVAVLLLPMIRLFVPVTPPEKVIEVPAPIFPIVNGPAVALAASMIALA